MTLCTCAVIWACSDQPATRGATELEPAAGVQTAAEEIGGIPPGADLDSIIELGIDQYYEWNLDSAESILSGVAAAARDRDEIPSYVRALTWSGLTARKDEDYSASRRTGERALELKLRHGVKDQLARSYNALGLTAWDQTRLGDASDLFRLAAEAATAVGDSAAHGKAIGNLALVQTDLGEFGAARNGFVVAYQTARQLGDTLVEANNLTNLGMLDILVGNPRAAIPRLQEARARYRSAGFFGHEENPVAQLGTAYAALGELGRAHAMFDTALALARDNGDSAAEAADTEILAELYREAGEYRRALTLFERARAIFEELGYRREVGANLRSQAEIYSALGSLDRAVGSAEEALEVHRQTGVRFEHLRDLCVLAELAHLQNMPAVVESRLAEAATVVDSLEAGAARMTLNLTRARIAISNDAFEQTLSAVASMDADLERAGQVTIWEAEYLRARAHLGLDRRGEALRSATRAVETLERIRADFGSGVLRSSFTAAKSNSYSLLVEIQLLLGRPESAFETSDMARGRILSEKLTQAASDISGTGSVAELLLQSEEQLRTINSLVSALDSTERAVINTTVRAEERQKLRRRLAEKRGEYEALLVRVGEQRSRRADLLSVDRTRFQEVRASLAPQEALIEYLVTDAGILIFVLTPEGVRVARSDLSPGNLVSRVRLARDIIGDPGSPAERSDRVLRGLFAALIKPALQTADLSNASRLLIIPNGPLSYLPFSALTDPTTGRRLVEDYSILVLARAANLPALRMQSPPKPARDTDRPIHIFAPFPDDLPGSREEAETVTGLFRGAAKREGQQATEESVRRELSRSRIVHLATHGVLNPRSPMFSSVSFRRGTGTGADDGRLEVHELLGMRIEADLVFLSGCETGLGAAWSTQYLQGEDYATLAQAFLYAGAENVVATLWRIEDQGAAQVAKHFYEQLRTRPPVEALAAAQRSLIGSGKYGAPYYWAAYRISGSGM